VSHAVEAAIPSWAASVPPGGLRVNARSLPVELLLNMKLLSSETASNVKRVFCIAKGMSDTEVQTVRDDIVQTLKGSAGIHVDNQLSCNSLFGEYWRTL
jgi:hypothetical protein